MIIVMQAGAAREDLDRVVARVEELRLKPHVIVGTERTVVAVVGDERDAAGSGFETLPGVASVMPILAKANPDGKLVYVIRSGPAGEKVEITTRSAVEKRGDTLPPGQDAPAAVEGADAAEADGDGDDQQEQEQR